MHRVHLTPSFPSLTDAGTGDAVLPSQRWDQPRRLTLHTEGSGPASETNSEVTCCIVIDMTSPMAQNLETTYFVSKQHHWWQNKTRIPSGEKTTPKCHGRQGAKGPKQLTVLQTQPLSCSTYSTRGLGSWRALELALGEQTLVPPGPILDQLNHA